MKKKLMKTILLTLICSVLCGTMAFAQEKTMPDGTVFDAEYYAQSNPDVVAALGTDENLLYQHYVVYGKNEGRKATNGVGASAVAQTTQSLTDANGVYNVPREQQSFPDKNKYRGFNITYNGKTYTWGIEAQSDYEKDCRNADAAKLANGTLQRIPVGAIIDTDIMFYSLMGYEGQYVCSIGDKDYCVITRDKLAEAVATLGVQKVVSDMVRGYTDDINNDYLENSGNYHKPIESGVCPW
ncbi:MAG: hypothetical protein J6B10_04800 [Lachnospiraceae bacterium]|nr:hypothetical protein [Lachnospiraceae bacterium]